MKNDIERDLGTQPISKLMDELGLGSGDLVENSGQQLTYKMVARVVKGRRLTPNIQRKVLNALNKASGKEYQLKDLFNYC